MTTFKQSADPAVVVYMHSTYRNNLMLALKSYKKYWGSIAHLVGYTDNLLEITTNKILITDNKNINTLNYEKIVYVDHIANITHLDIRRAVINTSVTKVNSLHELITKISDYDTIACDFETASKYSSTSCQKELKTKLSTCTDDKEITKLVQKIEATGLSYPKLTTITHISIAVDEETSYVLPVTSETLDKEICNWLVTTDKKQIWHNATFDLKIVYDRTSKFPKTIVDDTMLMWKTILNDANSEKAEVGLKTLAKEVYGNWGEGISNLFTVDNILNENVIYYAGIDTMATFYLFNKANRHKNFKKVDTEDYTVGIDSVLPASNPKEKDNRVTRRYFYENVVKHLIYPTVRLMMTGIKIDENKVEELENTIVKVLNTVDETLHNNELIKNFLKMKEKNLYDCTINELQNKKKQATAFLPTEFNSKKIDHISYLTNTVLEHLTLNFSYIPEKQLPNGAIRWTKTDIKKFININEKHRATKLSILNDLIQGTLNEDSTIVKQAMQKLAEDKAEIYNKKYDKKIEDIDIKLKFNPGSSKQKIELFKYLEVKPEKYSKTTGEPSWGREAIEIVNKTTNDENIREITQMLIEFSFSSIIKTNFIAAFKKYTVDGRLYGNYNLFGAKSFRYTSSNPNMLNAPSSNSKYAKPLKACFTAEKDFLVCGSDYAQLEDRIITELSGDAGKKAIFDNNLDAHCYNALGYYTEQIEKIIGSDGTYNEKVIRFKNEVENNSTLKKLRQNSKPVTFKCAYLGMPDSDKGGVITQEIYDNYWNVLYKDIGTMKERIISECRQTGESYLGLGCYIKSSNINKEFRTIFNANSQFWSILTAIAYARLYKAIDKAGLQDDIKITATIYDSIYLEVKKDAKILYFVNNTLINLMTMDWIVQQKIPNYANLDVDFSKNSNWADVKEIQNDISLEQLKILLNEEGN